MKMTRKVEGNLHVNRADKAGCRCCRPLPHSYSWGVKIKPRKSRYPGLTIDGLTDWIHENLGDWIGEGSDTARVSVTITLSDEPLNISIKRPKGEPA